MKYYCIFTDLSGLNGIPVFLDARIFEEEIIGNPYNVKNYKYYNWMKSGFTEDLFPNPLYLYTKNEKFSFDYYFFTSAFILSDSFLDITNKYNKEYYSSELKIFPWKKDKKINVIKNYKYVKYNYLTNIIDFSKSICIFSKDDKGERIVYNGVQYVSEYKKIVFNESKISKELFLIKDTILGRNLFCSERFRDEIGFNLYGIQYVDIIDLPDYIKYKGYLGKATYERLRNR